MTEIAVKTDFSEEYVYAICYLLDHGEERLLAGVEKGIIPPSIAMEIARAKAPLGAIACLAPSSRDPLLG